MAISEAEIAQVRAATDIVALVTEQVALKRQGRRWVGLCPFHAEKSGSFSVNAEEGLYYCYGCRVSGDVITWVRETHHVEFIDAVRFLADKAGIELHENDQGGPARKDRQEFLAAMDAAVTWYHDKLLNDPAARPARDYLRTRGISGEVARQFKIGWAPDEWDGLTTALNLSKKVLEGTGLGFINQRDRRQDALRARIIFPICDPSGKVIAVGGRILPGAAPRPDGRTEAKYKNSPETPIYAKRRTLYGLHLAKDDIIKSGEIIVCEGYTDVIACFMAGLPRAVATCGTALGEEHFRTMRNFAKRIVLAYDADGAGQSAAASVYQWEKKHDVDVAVARLPQGMDPGELGLKDPEALRTAIAQAIPFLQFRLNRVLDVANVSTAEGRARAAEACVRMLAEHPSELVRDQYLINVADHVRVDVSTLRNRLHEVLRRPHEARDVPAPPPRRREPLPRPGQEALRLLMHSPQDIASRLESVYFVHETQRRIYDGLRATSSALALIDVLRKEGNDLAVEIATELSVDELGRRYSPDDVAAVVAQLLRAAVSLELKNVERELRQGVMPPDEAMTTIRDVKEQVALLEGPQHAEVEANLRQWLLSRKSSE